jgi:hypothetical protein
LVLTQQKALLLNTLSWLVVAAGVVEVVRFGAAVVAQGGCKPLLV